MSGWDAPYVFMSYRSIEQEAALQVARDLRQRGIRVWMDQLDGLAPGDNWVSGLQEAIDNANGMLVMLSPQYVTSKFCRRELLRADTLDLPLFPLLLEDMKTTKIPLVLQETQYIDLQNWQDSTIYQNRLNTLIATLRTRLNLPANTAAESINITAPVLSSGASNARRLEDRINRLETQIQGAVSQKRSVAMRYQRIQTQLGQYEKEYEAVTSQLLIETNPATRSRLTIQLEQIESHIDNLENELDDLQ